MTTLTQLEPTCTTEEALALYDSLPAIRAEELAGRWAGRELGTGHPMDGLLEASGWYGKQFDSVDEVHPLLFRQADGTIFPVDPRRIPLGLAGRIPAAAVDKSRWMLPVAKPAIRTRKHRARLRNLEHRGVVSAAMIYDPLPIIDSFRRVDDDTLLGVMDLRGVEAPYFFILSRD